MSSGGSKKRGLAKTSLHVGPNMTPMVDIVMCILIFFMLGSTFASPDLYLTNTTPAVKTGGLSHSTGGAKMPHTRIEVHLDRRGDRTMATIGDFQTEDLTGQLDRWLSRKHSQMAGKVEVLIAPTKEVPYQDVISVYDACMHARFKIVAFTYAK